MHDYTVACSDSQDISVAEYPVSVSRAHAKPWTLHLNFLLLNFGVITPTMSPLKKNLGVTGTMLLNQPQTLQGFFLLLVTY